MTAALAWAPPRSAISEKFEGLLARLADKHQIKSLEPADFAEAIKASGLHVILLTEDPAKVPESWDMAVVFPDLIAGMMKSEPIHASLLSPAASASIAPQYSVRRMPAMLFMRDGGYVGALEGLRDWSEFVVICKEMLQKPISRAPIGIVVNAASTSCH